MIPAQRARSMSEAIYLLGISSVIYLLLNPQYYVKGESAMSKKKVATIKKVNETERKVRTILSELIGIDETDITPLSKIQEDLGADSLDIVEFVMLLEEEFGILIADDQGEKVITVADAVRLVDRLSIVPQFQD